MFKLARPAGLIRLLALILPAALAACNTTASAPPPQIAAAPAVDPMTAERYAAVTTDKHPVPGVDPATLKPRNVRQLVDYAITEKPGTIVIDTNARFIDLVQEGGKALRYGVGVGKEGLEFKGSATVQRKAQWPRWTPTPDMIRREPERYRKWASGMDGGTDNPLGARALYLFKDGKDTLYRIHGTNEPETIGEAVSSGCIRMMNQDVIDLYSRVPTGAKVVVL
jgi:lipoprotein-anchoring transpeptidase ErfK/SrfK